jgi:hypothetical protein
MGIVRHRNSSVFPVLVQGPLSRPLIRTTVAEARAGELQATDTRMRKPV